MINLFRKLAIKTVLRVRWRLQPRSLAKTLARFSDVEADSAWHFGNAADLLEHPIHRAAMIATAVEETHHAYLFKNLATRDGGDPGASGLARKQLLGSAADLPRFLAYTHISEGRIHQEFSVIARASVDADVKATIASISADEGAHEEDARQMLREVISPQVLERAIHHAKWKRTYDDWMFAVGGLGHLNSTIWLSLVYLALGGVAAASCRRRLKREGPQPFIDKAREPRIRHTTPILARRS
jgi:rubrerythrin